MCTYTSLDMHDYTLHICVCRMLSAYETCVHTLLPVVVMLVIVFGLQQRFPLGSCNCDCRMIPKSRSERGVRPNTVASVQARTWPKSNKELREWGKRGVAWDGSPKNFRRSSCIPLRRTRPLCHAACHQSAYIRQTSRTCYELD